MPPAVNLFKRTADFVETADEHLLVWSADSGACDARFDAFDDFLAERLQKTDFLNGSISRRGIRHPAKHLRELADRVLERTTADGVPDMGQGVNRPGEGVRGHARAAFSATGTSVSGVTNSCSG